MKMRFPRFRGWRPSASKKLTLALAGWLFLGIVAAFVTFWVLFQNQKQDEANVVTERCSNRAKAMQSELANSFSVADMYSGLVRTYSNISKADFQTFADTTGPLIPFSQGITYLKNVLGPDRAAAEAALGRNFTQYGPGRMTNNPEFVPRDPAPEYFVTWRSSLPEYEQLYAGYDTLSNPRLAPVARAAQQSGQLAVTYPFPSVLGSTAVAVYYPVYNSVPLANATTEALIDDLIGFIVTAFNVTSLFDNATGRFQTSLSMLRVYDITPDNATSSSGPFYSTPPVAPHGMRFEDQSQFTIGGRSYNLVCETDVSLGSLLAASVSWAAVLLLLFLVVALFLYVMAKRFQRKKEEVRKIEKLNKEFEAARYKAESADKAKSAFLATMSHELRTPLTGTLGMLDLLRLTPMTEAQSLYVTTMQTSAESLLGCLNDILDFSKIEAGQLRLEDIDLDISALVQRVVALFSGKLLEKGLQIKIELPPAEDCKAKGDPLRLQQVLSNLLSNAIKFTHAGSIAIRWQRLSYALAASGSLGSQGSFDGSDTAIDVEESQEPARPRCLSVLRKRPGASRGLASVGAFAEKGAGGFGSIADVKEAPRSLAEGILTSEAPDVNGADPVWFEFSVSDTGLGITPEAQQNLFKSFVQADDSTTRMYGGTGLGLVICKKLVNAMGGTITVQSQLNEGTTFTCTVRLQKATQASTQLSPVMSDQPGVVGPVVQNPTDLLLLSPTRPRPLMENGAHSDPSIELPSTSQYKPVPRVSLKEQQLEAGENEQLDALRNDLDGEKASSSGGGLGLQINPGLMRQLALSAPEMSKEAEVATRDGDKSSSFSLRKSSEEDGTGSPTTNSEFGALAGGSPAKESARRDEISEVSTSYSGLTSRSSGSAHFLHSYASTSSEEQLASETRADILVAEDNMVNQMLIKKMLKHHGHNVDIVGNGRLAVDALKEKAYTLCLMDLQMPVLDGIHATEEIRSSGGPNSDVPIYILSADVLARNKLRHLKINGYLTKPIKWEMVLSLISEQLRLSKV